MFLEDDELIAKTTGAIRTERRNAEFLFNRRVAQFTAILAKLEDEYFKARDSDVNDIANRVINNLAQLAGRNTPSASMVLRAFPPESILVAADLAPSEASALTGRRASGLLLERGGATSHTAIMAKALELPAVMGAAGVAGGVPHGARLIVDGQLGRAIVNPTEATLARYEAQRAALREQDAELALLRDSPPETLDGYLMDLRANVELPEEVSHIAAHGARGVGLFRSEFIFMNRATLPTEDEQCRVYRAVLEGAAPHSAVLRTLDLGGDKLPSARLHGAEANPFMGERAVRLCLPRPELFKPQLRAMLRASVHGKARILIPMISGVEEFVQAKQVLRDCKAELRAAKIPFDTKVRLGAMIEVPSAAVVADDLARVCDFFSIGTNDLVQYTLAVDRGNERVANLYEPLHPAVMKLLRQVVAAARRTGIPVTVCGEVAADPVMAVILLGLGVDELSMTSVGIPHVKKLIRGVTFAEAKAFAEEVMAQTTVAGIKRVARARLRGFVRSKLTGPSPMLHR